MSPNDADMRNYKLNSSAKALSRSSALLFFLMDGAVFRGGNTCRSTPEEQHFCYPRCDNKGNRISGVDTDSRRLQAEQMSDWMFPGD